MRYRRRKIQKRWGFLVVVVLGVLLSFLPMAQGQTLEGPYPITKISDGDTMHILIDGKDQTVRLIGIDTPESVIENPERITKEGIEASLFMKKTFVVNTPVYLEYDEDKYDKYDRILAYVYLDAKGEERIQDLLLKKGYARCMVVKPNTKYEAYFATLEGEAKTNKVGFWQSDIWN